MSKGEWRHNLLHLLYDPFSFGRKAYRIRFPWLHEIHLIPGSVLDRSCRKHITHGGQR